MRTENSHRGFPLSTKNQMPSQLQGNWEGPSFIHSEEEKDMLWGNTILVDAVMCLPDVSFKEGFDVQLQGGFYLITWGIPHNQVGQRDKDQAISSHWLQLLQLSETMLTWEHSYFTGLLHSLTSFSAPSCFIFSLKFWFLRNILYSILYLSICLQK